MNRAGAKVRVLIVEDDALVCRALLRALGDQLTVLVATSVDQAQDTLRVEVVDVVVTDYDLGPGARKGSVLLRELQAARPGIRRFLMSGGELDHGALEPGLCEAVFAKPFNPSDLLARLLG